MAESSSAGPLNGEALRLREPAMRLFSPFNTYTNWQYWTFDFGVAKGMQMELLLFVFWLVYSLWCKRWMMRVSYGSHTRPLVDWDVKLAFRFRISLYSNPPFSDRTESCEPLVPESGRFPYLRSH